MSPSEPFLYSNQLSILRWSLLCKHFFNYDKRWRDLRYPFANVETFCDLQMWFFLLFDGVNSIKTALQTCNLWFILSVSYKFVNWSWWNLPPKMANKNNIWKWLSFAISTFVIIEEITSGVSNNHSAMFFNLSNHIPRLSSYVIHTIKPVLAEISVRKPVGQTNNLSKHNHIFSFQLKIFDIYRISLISIRGN